MWGSSLVIVLFLSAASFAQQGSVQPAPSGTSVLPAEQTSDDNVRNAAMQLTSADIEKIVEAAKADVGLSEEAKARVVELAAGATGQLNRAQQLATKMNEFRALKSTVSKRKTTMQQQLEQIEQFDPQLTGGDRLPELEQQLEQRQADLSKLKERQTQLESQATTRGNRRTEIRRRLDEIETSQNQLRQLLTVPPTAGEDKSVADLRVLEALSRFQANELESQALSEELDMFDAETAADLLQLERRLNARRISNSTEAVKVATSAVQAKRQAAAKTVLQEAEKVEEEVEPWLLSVTKRNRELAEQNSALATEIASTESRLKSAMNRLEEWERKFSVTKDKVDSVGLPASMGVMLRQLRANLPSERALKNAIRARQPLIEQSQLNQFDLADERTRLDDIDREVDRVLNELISQDPAIRLTEEVRAKTRVYLEKRQAILNAYYKNETTYFQHLTDLDFAQEKLANTSQEFATYIDELVLWVRSEPPLVSALTHPASVSKVAIGAADRSMTDWENLRLVWGSTHSWREFAARMEQDVKLRPFLYLAAAILFGVLFFLRSFIAVRLQHIAERTRSSSYSRFMPTIHTAIITGLASVFVPSVILFFAWRFGQNTSGQDIAGAMAIAGKYVGSVLLPIALLKHVFRHNGLAEAHFDASPRVVRVMRSNIRWFPMVFVPLLIAGVMARATSSPASGGVVYRLFFITSCFVVSVFVWRVFHPRLGILSDYLSQNEGSWLDRLQAVWFFGGVLTPIGLAILSGFGYAYSSQVIAHRLFLTMTAGALLLVLRGLAMRLLLVHRRKLSIEQARARYEEFARKQANADEAGEVQPQNTLGNQNLPGVGVTADGIAVEEDPLADLRANTAQSRRLLSTVLFGAAIIVGWMIWNDILPAFGFLESWPLWNSRQQVAEVVTNDRGLREISTSEILDPVTVPDIVISVLIAGISLVSARDLPGLLEIAVLKRLPLENSVRYAITTLARYAIAMMGLIFACRWAGLHWQQVQWMATALTFGLAFGLQEMFANFVSGVIILFERPIRVGDIVTIDDVTGVVSRVRIRATTVTNWDRKDYIVPNKDFITGRLLNWTLSDNVNRLVIEVGVAYGTDTTKAKKQLVDIAQRHAIIVDEPAPSATFEEFGDSSLKLVLRCFISMDDMPMRLTVIDELHTRIDREFAESGIEIAFPQQDVHVRHMPPPTK